MPRLGKLQWFLRRLSVMSPREIGFRFARALRLAAEQALSALGWEPRPKQGCTEASPLLGDIGALLADIGAQELAELDAYRAGRLFMFDREWQVGRDVDWNVDPKTALRCPLGFGKKIDYRDAAAFGDCKTLWELGRFTMSVPLALGYARTGNRAYVDKLAADVNGWLEQCPFGRGGHWVSSLEVALRLVAWSFTHEVLRAAGIGGGLLEVVADRKRLERSIYQHCWYIRSFLSEHSSANNHLIGELVGLTIASTTFRFGEVSDRWSAYGAKRLNREFLAQNHPDGVNKEQAVYYHMWTLEYLLLFLGIAQRSGVEALPVLHELAGKMIGYVLTLSSRTARTPPHIGDSDDGRALQLSARPETNPYAWLWDFADTRGSHRRVAFYRSLLGAAHERIARHVIAPADGDSGLVVFEQGGCCVFHAPGQRLVFDTGPLGYGAIAAHGHADCLSVVLQYEGLWWLCDPGTYAYHTEPQWRDHFRHTRVHNTVAIDGRDQSEIGGAFLWLRKARCRDLQTRREPGAWSAAASHDGYAPLEHTRRVAMTAEGYEITDRIDGTGTHEIALCFQLHPELEVAIDASAHRVTATRDGANMRIEHSPTLAATLRNGSQDPMAGWVSDRLGSKQAAPHVTLAARLTLPVELTTRIALS